MKKVICKKILALTVYFFVGCNALAQETNSQVPESTATENSSDVPTDDDTDSLTKPLNPYENGSNSQNSIPQQSRGASLEDNINPLYWKQVREKYIKSRKSLTDKNITEKEKRELESEERKKASAEAKKLKELSALKNKSKEQVDVGANISLKKKPSDSYRTAIMPDLINRKTYDKENLHLPQVAYEDDYKRILFQAILDDNLDVMRAVIEKFKTTEVRDENGNTPLLFATITGNLVPAKILIGMGAAVNVTNNEGFSPVYIATKDNNIDLANLLIKAGSNVQIKTKKSKTTLMTATENNDARMVSKLINIGLEANARTDDGNTALHLAAIKNNSLAADILISNDADYDLQNNEGLTPLMLASAYGSKETVNLLLQSGADITIKDSYGQDAYTLAKNNRQTVIMAMLTSASFRDSQNKSSFDEKSGEHSSSFVSGVRYEQPFVNPSLQDKSPIRMPIPMFTKEEKNRM